jgi:hypothetical protein
VVTVELNGAPTIEVAEAALVMTGATFSVSVCEELPATLNQFDSSPP